MKISAIKQHLPWWSKILGKLVLARLPIGYSFWQKAGLFRHGYMDSHEYAINVFGNHIDRAGLPKDLTGKTILELGPGDGISTAIIAASYGAQPILVDAGAFASADLSRYQSLVAALQMRGLKPPNLTSCKTLQDILTVCNAVYLTNGVNSLREISDDTVDLIFSQAVLEHIRKSDFLPMMKECRRILKHEGVCSHRIDLKDHLGGGLNNLRFRDRIWESEFFVRSGFYTNRIRFSQMTELFSRVGFCVDVLQKSQWERLPIHRRKLSHEFRDMPDEELLVYGFDVILKPE